MNKRIYLSLAMIAMLCLVGWNGFAQKSNAAAARQTWEYKVVTAYGTTDVSPANTNKLNEMGAEGWELVSILSEESARSGATLRRAEFYFKRAK